MKRLFVGVLLYILFSHPFFAVATTWHVEQDGSGDFTVIQAAVDAASSGDVIMIGPGRYTGLSYQNSVALLPGDRDLTLIGAGADVSILSGEALDGTQGVSGLTRYGESDRYLEIKDLAFEHFSDWAVYANGGEVVVSGCDVAASCTQGVFIRSESGGRLENSCLRSWFTGIHVAANGDAGFVVSSNICVIQTSDQPLLSFNENDFRITDESALYVRVLSGGEGGAPPVTADLANNYWGTTDAVYVADRIHDAVDDPALDMIVEFLPMAGGSVPTENTGWGDLKAAYLGR